ncbi:hypothetical protein [Nocardioides alpinus]|uniref:hypothetical protein n=1 Tax=Nocardioides alpinus TaxID=748909 RepID=UPI0012FEB418|nr:hypothetical protein [Nocardioides alpinus]
MVWLSHDAYFWGDDWTFLLRKGTIPGEAIGTLMDPYNSHWSLAHGLTYRLLFEIFGMKTYVPWLIVLVAFHAVIVLSIHYILRRTGCPRSVALGTALAILVTGVAPEMVVWDAAMSHSGALALGFLALAVVVGTDARRAGLVVAAALLSVALMFSATGISVVVLTAVFVAAQHGLRRAALVAGPPIAMFVMWLVVWGREVSGVSRTFDGVADVPNYVFDGLTKVFGTAVGVPGVGPVVVVALMINLLTDRDSNPALRALAWSGLAAAVAQLVLEGVGRLQIGQIDDNPNRYAYFSLVLLSPALALGFARILRTTIEPRWLPLAGVSLALVGYSLHGVSLVREYSAGYTAVSRSWLDRFEGIIASADAGQRPLAQSYDDPVNGGITQELIASQAVRAVLPDGTPSPADRLGAEMMFNVGVGTQTYDLFNPAFVDLAFGWNREIKKLPGCQTYVATVPNPMLQIATMDGIEIGVTSVSTEVTTRLVRDDMVADGRIWNVPAGSIHIASTAKDAVLQVSFNAAGEYTICKQ